MVVKYLDPYKDDVYGKLPVYTVAAGFSQRKGGGKSYGLSPDDRLLFIKKQLCADLASSGFTSD